MGRRKDPDALNKREKAILKFIEKEVMINGYPPSVREIGKAVGLKSTATRPKRIKSNSLLLSNSIYFIINTPIYKVSMLNILMCFFAFS